MSSRSPERPSPAAPCQPSSSSAESSSYMVPDPWDSGLLFPVTRSTLLARHLLRLRGCSSHGPVTRRKREMIPSDKKDATYWDKRNKNNEAARRSREKRRMNDLMMESQLLAMADENAQLRAQVLSLQYHSRLTAEKSKAAFAETFALPSSAKPKSRFEPPGLFQAGLWCDSKSSPASVLSMREQEKAIHPPEAKIPCFSSTRGFGGFDGSYSCGTQQGLSPLSGPRAGSHRTVLEGGRSAEAEMDAQRQVSSSDDIPNSLASPIRALLSTADTLHKASVLSYPAPGWVVPHADHPAVCNNFILPWRSAYLPPPAICPGLPLYIQETQDQGLGVEADAHRGFKGRLSSAIPPAGLSQLGMHLRPDGH
uniref:uncharacterized protein si:dkey-172o19.2 n=1 Tax=Scatophagus argus TaxID=75038 RepID=UPI001ED80223|nr:uncharacterized protein si:dkey-172o19.2 [Scatophagus argus]XP_046248123.1 uncharacterized protein si:dkey-172o19.2 [Scatophagus argus]